MRSALGRKSSDHAAGQAHSNEQMSRSGKQVGVVREGPRVPSREKGSSSRSSNLSKKSGSEWGATPSNERDGSSKERERKGSNASSSSRPSLASIASSQMQEKEETVGTTSNSKKVKKKSVEEDPRNTEENARMDAMFDTMFQGLQSSLTSIISDSNLVTRRTEPDEELERTRADIENKLRRDMLFKMKEDAFKRLHHIEEVGKATIEQLVEEKRRLKTEERLLIEIVTQLYNTACVRQETIIRRLNMQQQGAERRMRELVFEVIGEYGKSELRMKRRKEYLTYVSTMQHMWTVRKACWDRFAARLVFESCVSCLPTERASSSSNTNTNTNTNTAAAAATVGSRSGHYYGSKFNLRYSTLCRVEDAAEVGLVGAYAASVLGDLPTAAAVAAGSPSPERTRGSRSETAAGSSRGRAHMP
jgi:hypothetical protein